MKHCNLKICQCLIDMQHGDVGMHHRHGHAAWTWICSTNMDMQHGQAVQTISTDKCTYSMWCAVWFSLNLTTKAECCVALKPKYV